MKEERELLRKQRADAKAKGLSGTLKGAPNWWKDAEKIKIKKELAAARMAAQKKPLSAADRARISAEAFAARIFESALREARSQLGIVEIVLPPIVVSVPASEDDVATENEGQQQQQQQQQQEQPQLHTTDTASAPAAATEVTVGGTVPAAQTKVKASSLVRRLKTASKSRDSSPIVGADTDASASVDVRIGRTGTPTSSKRTKRVQWSAETGRAESAGGATSPSRPSKTSRTLSPASKNVVVKGKKDNKTTSKNWLSAAFTDGKKTKSKSPSGSKAATTGKGVETENVPPTPETTTRRVSPNVLHASIAASQAGNDPVCNVVLTRAAEEPLGVLLQDLKVAALSRNAISCGLTKGDTIIGVNGQGVRTSEEAMAIMLNAVGPISITLIRSGFDFEIEDV